MGNILIIPNSNFAAVSLDRVTPGPLGPTKNIPFVKGGYCNPQLVPATSYSYSSPFKVRGGDMIVIESGSVGAGAYIISCFDKDGSFMRNESIINVDLSGKVYTIPDNVDSVQLCSRDSRFEGSFDPVMKIKQETDIDIVTPIRWKQGTFNTQRIAEQESTFAQAYADTSSALFVWFDKRLLSYIVGLGGKPARITVNEGFKIFTIFEFDRVTSKYVGYFNPSTEHPVRSYVYDGANDICIVITKTDQTNTIQVGDELAAGVKVSTIEL